MNAVIAGENPSRGVEQLLPASVDLVQVKLILRRPLSNRRLVP
jgi:hypothetical protein